MKPCGNPDCTHLKRNHEAWGTRHPGQCLVPGCACRQYVPPGQRLHRDAGDPPGTGTHVCRCGAVRGYSVIEAGP
ncbi:MAG TPA: hypothetical protein VMG99_09025 [Thermoplasmata archaeon]|nr:hypothetical protein [Thermoplasmata archaeon]